MMPIQVISRPDAHHERMVMSDFRAPTAKCATRLIPKEAITASKPPEKKNGIIGTNAPIAVEMPADKAAGPLFGDRRSRKPSSPFTLSLPHFPRFFPPPAP